MAFVLLRLPLLLPALVFAACGQWTPESMMPVAPGGCRTADVTWLAPQDARDRRRLDAWCAGGGAPVVIDGGGTGDSGSARIEDVVFVSWNVHVGNGDVRRFVTDLREGAHTGGRRVDRFVLILQEAVRTSGVPELAPGMSGASHIAPHAADDSVDIVRIARDLGLSLIYVPSMRNGRSADDPRQDRGNALLATTPLSDAVAIELPGEGQRRVAILATAGPVSVAALHLDALGSWGLRWRMFWTSWMRDAQIRSVEQLLPAGPLVVGADLNSWHGRGELAVNAFSRLAGATPVSVDREGLGLRVLDYLFFRVGEHRRAYYHDLEDRYGSDHRPLVGWVQ